MRNRVIITAMYAEAYSRKAAATTKKFAAEHQSEMATAAVTAFVVGTAARASGFRAGYAYANNS